MLEEGSLTAHVVIVARAMGVPVLGRVRKPAGLIREGDALLLDADAGTLTVRPLADRGRDLRDPLRPQPRAPGRLCRSCAMSSRSPATARASR